VRLASLPHPIRLQIAERARSLALRLDTPKALQPDITSFFVRSAPNVKVLLLLAPKSTGVAPIVSAYAFVLHVYIARLLVLAAVKRNVVVFAAEYRFHLTALVLALLVSQANMVSVLVLCTEQLLTVLLTAISRQNIAALVSAQFRHHVYMVHSLVLDAKPRDAVVLAAV
jgi:hypothetical protein